MGFCNFDRFIFSANEKQNVSYFQITEKYFKSNKLSTKQEFKTAA